MRLPRMPLMRRAAAVLETLSGKAFFRQSRVIPVSAARATVPKNQLACSAPFITPKAMPVLWTRTRLKNPGITSMRLSGDPYSGNRFRMSHFVHWSRT